ncbi:lipase family protein [Nocardia sp. XZ_19_369]|uniref:lipase family protein n=1 Tax=Nocardia sp. XZ_19_369 TaxID=2769487 RepID=UPI00188FD215|nr:lipase family protein [Nocardia sp. XZ_19_369]
MILTEDLLQDNAFHRAGTLVRSEELPTSFWPGHAGMGYRVWYQGIGYDGSGRIVSGSVFVPAGDPPRDGWPVVSYAHGTTGLSDRTAPSVIGLSRPESRHVATWLEAGYVVTVTDYEGLASPGPHPYFNGEAAADDVVDIVRAAHQLGHPLSRRWIVVGFSQGGHAALFTGLMATKYAPELDFRGTVALAPPVEVPTIVRMQTADDSASVTLFLPYLLAGLRTTHGLATQEFMTGLGQRLIELAEYAPVRDIHYAVAVLTNQDIGTTGLNRRPGVEEMLNACRVPAARFDRPVMLAAGTADAVLPMAAVVQFAAEIRRAGTDIHLETCAGADHTSMLSAVPEILEWVGERMSATASASAFEPSNTRSGFELLDITGDGCLAADDYEAFGLRLVQAYGEAPGSPRAAAVRAGYRALWRAMAIRADVNGDGRITADEFCAWLRTHRDEDAFDRDITPLAQSVIDLADVDRNGVLDREELVGLLIGCEHTPAEASILFDRLDTDDSGTVTTAELIAAIRQFCLDPTPDKPGAWLFGRFR